MSEPRYGEWNWKGNGTLGETKPVEYDMVQCSACGGIISVFDGEIDHPYNFCSHCGADMRPQE